MPEYATKDKISFKEFVLFCLKEIFNLSCKEFRGGYWIEKEGKAGIEKIYIPDSRKCYCQAIENFAMILSAHFDKLGNLKKEYNEIIGKVDELIKQLDENKIDREEFIVKKLRLMKKLFGRLNFLLKELKITSIKTTATYG